MLKRYFSKYFGNDKGFTMIEMMVVLIIIAVLIGGGIRFYLGYVERAKVTKAKSEITTMQAALDSYYAENGSYPADPTEAGLSGEMISTDGTKLYKYTPSVQVGNDGYKKYEIETTDEFKDNKVLSGSGENGKSSPPALATQ
ncbi:MAG: ral secretion pathway protein [Clostridia bacterium]|nr:ral secretion pathway protein [Clostridia bacterium]